MRSHVPVTVEEFKGLWTRGDYETCPLDHFTECNNIQFQQGAVKTRDGIDPYAAFPNVIRMYTYNQPNQQGLLLLDGAGNIYHTLSPTPTVPILSIPQMEDFGFKAINGRAYISPNDRVMGLQNEFVYVYMGDGTAARKAAGDAPLTAAAAAQSAVAGTVELGWHIYSYVFETNTGFLTKLAPGVALQQTLANRKVDLSSIDISADSFVVARHIVATKAIDPTLYDGNLEGYQFFFVPDGNIDDNVTTTKTIDFYDADLIDDASHLLNILEEIPAGVNLFTYHNRLGTVAEYGVETGSSLTSTIGNLSLARLSYPGEPEAFDAVSGLIVTPLDSKPLTNGQEYRDVLYLFKQTKTFAYTDTGEEPVDWPLVVIDEGTGAPIHGIAYVLDSGGVNIDYVLICDWSGVMMFDGKFTRPQGELTWKIADTWHGLDRDNFNYIHMLNSSIKQRLYIVLPDFTMLMADYSDGLTPETIKWTPWTFDVGITAIALVETDKLLLASDGALVP